MSLLRNFFARTAPSEPRVEPSSTPTTAASVPQAQGAVANRESREIADEAARLDDAGRHAQSLALVSRALLITPADPDLLLAKGRTLVAWGRPREAIAALLRATDNGLRNSVVQLHLGWAYLGAGAGEEAERWMREAVATDPEDWRAHFGLAKAQQSLGRSAEAIASFEAVLARNPDEIESVLNLGVCRIASRDATAGEAQFRSALALMPGQAGAWNNLGVALEHQGKHSAARDAYERATQIESEGEANGGSYVNLALSLVEDGQTVSAIELLERHLPRHGGADAHGHYAQALRLAGRLPEGWTHFEFRWLKEPLLSSRPSLAKPAWTGQDLRGKTILLRAEQGLGDTLQFIRYASHVKAQGATVLLAAQSALRGLLRGIPGVDRVLGPEDSLPDIDYYVHLMSLPGLFATGLQSIPADVPYLQADSVRTQHWAQRLGDAKELNVGLVWAGRIDHVKDRERSMSLRTLGAWAGIEGVRFHSLQKGPPADETRSPPPGLELIDLGAELSDFADTAAVIERMDLVISVDTAVAHLAGAMGKPVWLMLPRPAEWRWMEDRKDSPWYPTMRLFRQLQRGEWGDVVERIRVALQAIARDPGRQLDMGRPPSSTTKRLSLAPVARLQRMAPGHRPGFGAVAETRYGILQYLPDEPRVGDSLGWYGEYLQAQLDTMARLLPLGATVLEAGAGVGQHSLSLSRIIGASGHLLVEEPRQMWQRILRTNLSANRITNATLLSIALGATGVSAETESLDALQVEQLDLLKLNDDRAAAILEGASETLWRLRPTLFAAASDEQRQCVLTDIMKGHGYRVWRTATPLFDPRNFNRRDDGIVAGDVAVALLAIPEEIASPAAPEVGVELN